MSLPEIAIAAALAWGAGLRAYAVMFAVGLAGALGWVELPGHLGVLQQPIVLAASGFMTCVEFFADKLPWLDSLWDTVHSFIRIPAGAALAAAVFGDSGLGVSVAAAILGGTLAGAVHLAKSGTRAAINTSPEPFSNWAVSLSEDALVPLGLWLAVAHPFVFFVLLAVFLVAAALLVRLLWRGLAALASRAR
ncbi:MAG TPA: DUF4126 domain-containing protein [Burkholderiales bacterium]|nr:DUF4126 domain-containing protein [Burkholderiales bacterium]